MASSSKILIVDDEPRGRLTLESLLARYGYTLLFAADGPEALAMAEAHTPDLILLDVMMPNMDGFEVCQRLRANPELTEIPILMLTALDDHESRLRGLEVGADDFISKPYDRIELRMRINTITRLNRYRLLHNERTKFAWITEHADDGYVILNATDEVLYANSQARTYLDLPLLETESSDETQNALSAETFLTIVQRIYHTQPETAWASWPTLPPLTAPQPRYLVRAETPTADSFWLQMDLLDLDLTTSKHRVLRLRDVTEALVAQHQAWKFQSLLTHKVRTPLVGLLASLELIADNPAEWSPSDLKDICDMGLRGAKRLHKVVEDVLAYSQAPSLAHPGVGCALAAVGTLATEISAELGLTQLTLIPAAGGTNVTDTLHLTLSTTGLEALLREILENAKKFHPQQAPHVEVSYHQSAPSRARIEVRDDGMNLSPKQLTRVWIPYFQGEKYFTGEVSGMGLGLPSVAAIVWGVGGTCHITNRPNGPGVIIALELPLATPNP